MRIAVIGAGYVGLVTAVGLADMGNFVTCIEIAPEKVTKLQQGLVPFYEPGLQELLERTVAAGRLGFTSSYEDGIPGAELVYICVGTPALEDGSVNTDLVWSAVTSASRWLGSSSAIVVKSTVPVGACRQLRKLVRDRIGRSVPVLSNPEFLRQGSAVEDMKHPDRVVLGGEGPEELLRLEEIYRDMGVPVLSFGLETAELIKYAANSFLALKISFINELSRLCDAVGADVLGVAEGVGMDKRIGAAFLQAGIGYGGSCFPKDTTGLIYQARQAGQPLAILESAVQVNDTQWVYAITKLKEALGHLDGRKVAILGLSFKPQTDDLREAPSLKIIKTLKEAGVSVVAADPVVRAVPDFPDLRIEDDAYVACQGTDAILLVTEWPEFRNLDYKRLRAVMAGSTIVDGRNVLDAEKCVEEGFAYVPIGRGNVAVSPTALQVR